MIIECDKCKTKFNLDESLLNVEGSKVKCSICEHVFKAYPKQASPEKPDLAPSGLSQGPQALDAETAFEDAETEAIKEAPGLDLDMDFEVPTEKEKGEEEIQDQLSEEGKAPEGEDIGVTAEDVIESFAEKEEVPPMAAELAPSRKKTGRSKRFPIVLVIILLLLVCGAGGVYFFAPEMIPDSFSFLKPTSKQMADLGVRRLSFDGVTGIFLNSEKEGRVFAIKGKVINNYPKSRSFILVRGTILDDKGQTVKTKMVYAGNIFSEKQIEEMTLEEINNGLKKRAGKGNMNVNLGSGSSIPFMIILGNLPQNLSEFTVEAVSSSPGK